MLQEAAEEWLERAAINPELVARAEALRDALEADKARALVDAGDATATHPAAFFCVEFGIHRSMPIYSGGLGVLAGDILKEASDRGSPMLGIGLLYRQGCFHQRVDAGGWQHEYWYGTDSERRPCARITGADGLPLTLTVPVWGEKVAAHVWRVEVGKVPLFLLDTDLPENTPKQRFITSRLYGGNRQIRLAQDALLGVGGVQLLDTLGIEPGLLHMHEGHAVCATLALLGRELGPHVSFAEARERVARRVVFTTHTPVPAGNESYSRQEIEAVLPLLGAEFGASLDDVLDLGRFDARNPHEPIGMTALATRMSRSTNGVSRIHAEVSRRMWQALYPGRSAEQVPIRHVTNGAHLLS
jgi:starch phosphorylase